MAIDFEALITKHAGEDGSIPAASIAKAAAGISAAVGREFVAKDRYNTKLEEIETLKGEKQTAEDNATNAGKWEKKYNDLKAEYDAYKGDVTAKAQLETLKAAYKRDVLKPAGIADRYIDDVMSVTNFDGMKLDAEGKLEKADDYKKTAETKWASFKASTRQEGAHVDNPPANPAPGSANSRAAELAKQRHERMYGKAPAPEGGAND